MGIKRREFIKAGATTATVAVAAGAGGLVGSACAGLIGKEFLGTAGVPLPDMNQYLRTVDEGLRQISDWNLSDEVGETAEDLSYENDLAKKALRSMYLAGMFGDLPDAGQVHPGMQARIERALPAMDEAVFGTCDYLESLSEEDTRGIQAALKEKSDPGMEYAEWLNDKAWSVDVSTKRRLQTRTMLTHVLSRLRKQRPRAVCDEYVSKTLRYAERVGTIEEGQRLMIARVGEQAFWERQQRLAMYAARWQEEGATSGNGANADLPALEIPESTEMDGGTPFEDVTASLSDMNCSELDMELSFLHLDLRNDVITAEEFNERNQELRSLRELKACKDKSIVFSPTAARSYNRARSYNSSFETAGQRRIRRGGWVLGITGIVTAIGAPLVVTPAWPVSVGLATVAVILLQIGLVMVLVGNGQEYGRLESR